MPKELTYTDDRVFVVAEDGAEILLGPGSDVDKHRPAGPAVRRGVHVGWSRNQHVEIGVATFAVATEEVANGHFTSLDRQGINRVIRSLRKARDQAFGRDE